MAPTGVDFSSPLLPAAVGVGTDDEDEVSVDGELDLELVVPVGEPVLDSFEDGIVVLPPSVKTYSEKVLPSLSPLYVVSASCGVVMLLLPQV